VLEVGAPERAERKPRKENSAVAGVSKLQLWSREWMGTTVATYY
jgi:hypothetical protein